MLLQPTKKERGVVIQSFGLEDGKYSSVHVIGKQMKLSHATINTVRNNALKTQLHTTYIPLVRQKPYHTGFTKSGNSRLSQQTGCIRVILTGWLVWRNKLERSGKQAQERTKKSHTYHFAKFRFNAIMALKERYCQAEKTNK